VPTPWTPPEVAALVEPLVDTFAAEQLTPGLAYGVVQDGVLVLTGGRGRHRDGDSTAGAAGSAPDADTVFRIASMTKSFTAATVLALRDDGLLSLDDPIAAWLPQAQGMGLPTGDSAPITVRQLLTMTAGLPTDDPWGDRQQDLPMADFAALVQRGLRFAWPNGTQFEYANLGYALLGRLVTAVSGVEYDELVTGRLLQPLGMRSTGFDADRVPGDRVAHGHRKVESRWVEVPLDGYGAFAAMGGVYSTVADLARWVGGFTAAVPARGSDQREPDGHPLRRASRREMQQPHRTMPPQLVWTQLTEPPVMRVPSYGFGLFVESEPRYGTVVSHSGGYPGFGSHMRWHPDTGLGVIVLANSTYAPAGRLASTLLSALLAGQSHVDRQRATVTGASAAPPRTGGVWPETVAAQADVERLLTAWDDDLADRLLAMNVDLDHELVRRRADLARIVEQYGPLQRDPDPDSAADSDSPAHLRWWLRGRGGRMRVEIRLTPELPPRVQTLTVQRVDDPAPALSAAATAIVAQLGTDDPRWPAELAVTGLEAAALTRLLRVADAWAGAATLGPAQQSAASSARWLVTGERARLTLDLALSRAPDTDGAVSRCRITPYDETA
jgi:CubicO group peptidase (beta-lactamase class C family)